MPYSGRDAIQSAHAKKLVFVPVASATAGGHRDRPILPSVVQWPKIQPLV